MSSEREKEKTVNYDVRVVDSKISELEKFLFFADAKVKQANAITEVDIEADVDVLLAPLT